MSAPFALSRTTVTAPDSEPWTDATVIVDRKGTLAVVNRRTRATLARVEGVSGVEQVSKREWKITTPEGEYLVEKAKGCGCG